MMKNKRTIICFVPRYCYPLFENHLSKMSMQGWHLVKYRYPLFTFCAGRACKKEYFIYQHIGGITKDDGYFDLDLRHPFLFRKYAVKEKYSILNAFSKNALTNLMVFEVDGSKTDIGFNELKQDRWKYGYLRLLYESALFILPLTVFAFASELRFFRIGCFFIISGLLLNLLVGLVFTLLSRKK